MRGGKKKSDPFDPAILRRSKKIASEYRIVLEPSRRLVYVGTSVEIPTVFADGKTADACVKATRDALTLAVATMMECGQTPPAPASVGKREAQVNVRFATHEKFMLQQAARSRGFRSISDLIRSAALNSIRP